VFLWFTQQDIINCSVSWLTWNSSKWKSCLKLANLWPPELADNIQALPPSIAKFSQWTSLFRGLANSLRVPILAPPFSTRRVRCFSLVWYMKVVPGPPTSQVGVTEVEESFWHLPPWAWKVNILIKHVCDMSTRHIGDIVRKGTK